MHKNYLYSMVAITGLTWVNAHTAKSAFEKVKFLICGEGSMGQAGQASATSDVVIFKDQDTVRKTVREYLQYDVFNREVETLMKLRKFDHVPKILAVDFDNNTFYMEWGGVPLNKENLPVDWETQVKEIITGFHARGVQHNDIKNAELLVKNNKIMVIDYGWASEYGKPMNPALLWFNEIGHQK